ncbi:hypothetical protein B0H14DRAFT_3889119 [Mycena olivaceomarginata]|nr:hypothetical protein B0H14DRAFT_3889119 [Mycena olivaceomarginata]
MSSEENDVENHAGYLRNIFKVKFCAWRSSIITDYLRIVDDAAESSKGTRGNPGLPRVRSVEVGQSGPPRGLPRKMFDEEWLAAQERRPDYEEVLGISADVFEFMCLNSYSVIPGAQAIIVLKSEFPQMTLWLERKEKIYQHENYIQWRLDGCPSPPIIEDIYPGIVFERHLKMTKHPTLKLVGMSRLVTDYGATLFRDALARYVVHFTNLDLSPLQVEQNSQDLSFAFNSVPVCHRIKFTSQDPILRQTLKNGEDLPARFDTALVNGGNGQITGVAGYRVWSRST